MNNENIEEAEKFPTDGEVIRRVEAYLGEREYREVRRLEDDQGAYFWELKSVDEQGDDMFVYYKRVGNFGPNMFSNKTLIEVTYTMGGIECGGETLAEWQGGEWK